MRRICDRCQLLNCICRHTAEPVPKPPAKPVPKPPHRGNGDRTLWSEKARARTVFEPGSCRKCGLTKPLDQFPPPMARQPKWQPHYYICKGCVNEQVKEHQRRKWLQSFTDALPDRTQTDLASELRYLLRKVKAIRTELRKRDELQSSAA
jgi:hypothetical protein